MIVGREVGGGVTLFFWQRLLSGTTNKKQITCNFCPQSIVQDGPRGVNVSQSELYSFRLGKKPLKWLLRIDHVRKSYIYMYMYVAFDVFACVLRAIYFWDFKHIKSLYFPGFSPRAL